MQAAHIQPLDFFLLRTPALPYTQDAPWTAVIQTPAFQRALFFSSPDLYELLQELLAGRLTGANRSKVEKSLYKYWLRMSFRCTPFGLLAGPSLGEWGAATETRLGPLQAREYVRLDMGVVCQLVERLEKHPALRPHARFFPNNTLYLNHGKIRYIEPMLRQGYVHYQLTGVERNAYVEKVLAYAQQGLKLPELAARLVDEEVTLADAQEFVEDIATSQLLVSELLPRISDPAFERTLLAWLQQTTAAHPDLVDDWLLALIAFLTDLQRSYGEPADLTVAQVKELGNQLKHLQIDFSLKTLLQIDMFPVATVNHLAPAVFEELRTSLSLLWGTTAAREDTQLTRFKEAFLERYEEEEVPLLLVLDSESGLSFPVGTQYETSPLLQGLALPEAPDAGGSVVGSSKWDIFLQRKYFAALASGSTEIRLTAEEIRPLVAEAQPALPFSMISNVQLFKAPGSDDDFWVYHTASDGPSSSTLLGRFCCGDTQLQEKVEHALAREQAFHAEQIIAEIIHLPQSRIGNIIMRPKLRAYEIPLLSAAHQASQQVALADLLVSVRDNRVVLRSKTLNREIIPSLSSAHNYTRGSMPLYHFLASLQYQGLTPSYGWNWGPLRHATYQPRVVLNRTILARQGWLVEYEPAFKGRTESLDALRAYLQTAAVTQFVTFQELDNQLPIDLENDLALGILLDHLRKEKTVWLREDLFKVLASPVTDTSGTYRYNNEYSIPWEYTAARRRPPLPARVDDATITRDFAPGTEWLYLKLYCGVKLSDELITQVITPFASDLLAEGLISQWFFIRYADPNAHLRVRFRKRQPGVLIVERLHALLAPYLRDKSVWRVQQDTYKRELERYDPITMVALEEVFFHDSVAVGECLAALEENPEVPRWRVALVGIDYLLDDFGLTLAQKAVLLERMATSYAQEFGLDNSAGRKSLGANFRTYRANIEQDLQAQALYGAVFARRSAGSQASMHVIRQHLALDAGLGPAALTVIGSCVHMFVNRIFRSQQRLHELSLCDLLHRTYTSFQARQLSLAPRVLPLG